METRKAHMPQARHEGLVGCDLPDGTMVFDSDRVRFHRLNRTAALIWQHCDGETSVGELAALLRRLDLPADEDLVWLTLNRLQKARLLREPLSGPSEGISRRALIRKLGLAGGLVASLPIVATIIGPTPAMADSSVSVVAIRCEEVACTFQTHCREVNCGRCIRELAHCVPP